MTTFNEIKRQVAGHKLPCTAENENGEMIVIQYGKDEAGEFFQLMTMQHNDWVRVNTYYADGTVTETYKRGWEE